MSAPLTGRERLLRTLRCQPVDRMPVSPFLYYNSVYEMFGYTPDMDSFFDPDDFDPIEKMVEYCDRFGFDVLHVLGSVWDNWDVTIADERKGDAKHRTVTIRTPDGELRHSEAYERSSPYLVISAYREYPIKSPADFEIIRKHAPPADEMDCSLIRRARKAVGDKGLVTSIIHGAYNTLNQFRSLSEVLMDPILDHGFYTEMIEHFLQQLIKRVKKMVANGADVIEVAANLATSAVGPDYFQKYVRDAENRLLRAIHDAGALAIYHNCGDAALIMHLYNGMEMDCWGYLTPRPYGDVDLEEALRVIRPDMALRGNVDQVEFLRKATPAQVRERVREVVLKAKKRGNFILSSTDFFFDGTPYENIEAFAKAGREYGEY